MIYGIRYKVENLPEVIEFVKDSGDFASFKVKNRILEITKIDGSVLIVKPNNIVVFNDKGSELFCCSSGYFKMIKSKEVEE